MFKPFSILFFIASMVWFGSILITTDPQARMDRTCIPVDYAKRATTAGMLLVNDEWSQESDKLFDKWLYGCKFVIWRMFYENDWNKSTEAEKRNAIQDRQQHVNDELDAELKKQRLRAPIDKGATAQPEPPRRINKD